MLTRNSTLQAGKTLVALVLAAGLYWGCEKDEGPLAPYIPGDVPFSTLRVEGGVYAPMVSWQGGYVSALGVNRGQVARVDSTLAWLIHAAGNGVHYQPRFGQTPAGAEDLTASFGGHAAATLLEDQVYTFWVAREDAWTVINANPGKVLLADPLLVNVSRLSGDTLFLRPQSFIVKVNPVDVYIGIKNVRPVGRLGVISVTQTNTTNAPIITFRVNQTGTLPPDTLLADIGIASGSVYDVGGVIWEALAVDTTSGQPVYWVKDNITSPLVAGQVIPGTIEFTKFPAEGLQRNKTYYIWIANKNWDQRNRSRSAFNYASATFDTF